MTFDELELQGRSIPENQLDESVALLMRDPRFPALARLIRSHRENLVAVLSAPQTAGLPAAGTVLAHGAGGIDAIMGLEGRLTGILQR
jgi:hypothetical protein